MRNMATGDDVEQDPRRAAAELLRGLLDALPPDGSRDVALRRAVQQRAAAFDDLVNFEADSGLGVPGSNAAK